MVAKTQGDWGEYRALILEELKRLHGGIEELKTKIDTLRAADIADVKAEIAVLKFKSGLWGAVAGAVPATVALIYVVLHK